MHTSDRLLKFAAECEVMAKLARSRENKIVWNGLAQRWLRCVELINKLDSNLHREDSARYQRRPSKTFAH
jgi:hypothetical protein